MLIQNIQHYEPPVMSQTRESNQSMRLGKVDRACPRSKCRLIFPRSPVSAAWPLEHCCIESHSLHESVAVLHQGPRTPGKATGN